MNSKEVTKRSEIKIDTGEDLLDEGDFSEGEKLDQPPDE